AASLPDQARATHGDRRLARPVSPLLVGACRRARASPRSYEPSATSEKETMSSRENYKPGPATGAEVRKDGDNWTLIVVRELRHPPAKVWQALTDPTQLREWAPFDADRSLASIGPVSLSTVGTPTPVISETHVTRAEAPKLLEYQWGGNDIRW